MEFSMHDFFDAAEALHYWLQHNWDGMDELYKSYCLLRTYYNPSIIASFDNASSEVLYIYDNITLDNYKIFLSEVLKYATK